MADDQADLERSLLGLSQYDVEDQIIHQRMAQAKALRDAQMSESARQNAGSQLGAAMRQLAGRQKQGQAEAALRQNQAARAGGSLDAQNRPVMPGSAGSINPSGNDVINRLAQMEMLRRRPPQAQDAQLPTPEELAVPTMQ